VKEKRIEKKEGEEKFKRIKDEFSNLSSEDDIDKSKSKIEELEDKIKNIVDWKSDESKKFFLNWIERKEEKERIEKISSLISESEIILELLDKEDDTSLRDEFR